MTQTTGYYAEVTEHEWGQRPDGYILCIDKEKGKARATACNGRVAQWDDGCSTAGDFKFCLLSKEAVYDIKKAGGSVWIGESTFNKYVEQC